MLTYPSAAFRASAPRGTVLELWDGKDVPSGLNVGGVSGRVYLSKLSLSDRTLTLLDASGTVPLYEYAGTWTAAQTTDLGTGATGITSGATHGELRGADGAFIRQSWMTWGANNGPSIYAYSAGGTRATPTATPNGQGLFAFVVRGHDGSAYTGSKASFGCSAGSLWSGSSTETKWAYLVTPSGSTTAITGLEIDGLGLNSPIATASTSPTTGGGRFAGGVGIAGQVTAAQMATTTTTDSSTGTINALANPTGLIRLTGAAPDVRGLSNPGTSAARRVVLYCVNATTITHEGGTAAAADRITSDTGANISVAAGKSVELIYDTTSTRWRPVRF